MGAAATLNVIFNYLLIPKYGGVGAGIASTISYTFSAIGVVTVLVLKENISTRDILVVKTSDFDPLLIKLKLKTR